MKRFIVAFSILLLFYSYIVDSQTKETMKQEAEAQLKRMTPEEIDAKIRQYGMTRAEAEAAARTLGIDLETYLRRRETTPGVTTTPTGETPTPATVAPQQVVIIQPPSQQQPPQEVKKEEEPPKPPIPTEAPKIREPKTEAADLVLFGYSAFHVEPGVYEPQISGLADYEYVIGQGDVLGISLWGDVQSYTEYTVDKEGRILIPLVGPVMIAGLTVEKANKVVLKAMSRAYAGLVATPATIFMDISIARVRPVKVFIMGEVLRPGGYAVKSVANVFNSLVTAGGPLHSGSLREVRVVRSNRVIAKVDLYDYLIGSDKLKDLRVNDNDLLYVPLRGRTVGIKGEVLRSARFELLPGENLKRLFEFAGGIRTNIYLQRVQIDRIIPFAERKKGQPERRVFDIDFNELLKSGKDFLIEDGDVITVFPISDELKNFVTISGAVRRPGRYQFEKVSTFRDLLVAADSLLPEAYYDRAEVLRTFENERLQALNVDLNKVMKGDPLHNIKLIPRDRIRVYSIYEINAKRAITLRGHVKTPGEIPYADSLTVYDVLILQGGLQDSVYRAETFMERADLLRLNPDLQTRRSIQFDLNKLFWTLEGNMYFEPQDELVVYSRDEMKEAASFVSIDGRVKRPGTYPLLSNKTLYDLIFQNVGLTDTLFRKQIFLDRADLIRLNEDRYTTRIIPFNLWHLFSNREGDTLLLPGDRVVIFPIDAVEFTDRYVEIFGNVKRPGKYLLSENMTIVDLILQAGGYTEDAWMLQAEIARIPRNGISKDSVVHTKFSKIPNFSNPTTSNVKSLYEEEFTTFAMVHRDQVYIRPNPDFVVQKKVTLEGEFKYPGIYVLNIHNERFSHIAKRAGDFKLDAFLRGGRVFRNQVPLRLNLEDAYDDPEGAEDIILQPGDRIFIPTHPGVVQIAGEVVNPGIYGFVDGKDLSYYVDMAGGTTDSADFAIIHYPEGLSERANFGLFRLDPDIPDGSSIVVHKIKPPPPEPVEKEKGPSFYDVTKEVFAIMASALTIVVMANQLK